MNEDRSRLRASAGIALAAAMLLVGAVAAKHLLAQHGQAPSAPEDVPASAFTDAAGRRSSIPFELSGNKIFVPVTVNGSSPLGFVLDTGARDAVIDLERARSLGLKLEGQIAVKGAGEKSLPGSFVKGERYAVPGLAGFSRPLFLAMPLDEMAAGMGHAFDGILGYDFLSHFVAELDFERRLLTLHERTRFTYAGKGAVLPITLDGQSHPHVEALVVAGGRPLKPGPFLLDIGASNALSLNSPVVAEQRLLERVRKTVEVHAHGAGGALKGRTGRVDALTLGPFTLEAPIALLSQDASGAHASAAAQGSIGLEVLRRFRVFLDYGRSRIILEPTPRLAEPFEYDMSGLVIRAFGPGHRTFRVESVVEPSPAAAAGLVAGDVVVAAGDRAASGLSLADLREMLRKEQTVELRVRSGDAERKVTLRLSRRI